MKDPGPVPRVLAARFEVNAATVSEAEQMGALVAMSTGMPIAIPKELIQAPGVNSRQNHNLGNVCR